MGLLSNDLFQIIYVFADFSSEFYDVVLFSQQNLGIIKCENCGEIIISYNTAF